MTIETFELFDYQLETVERLYASYAAGNRRVATVVPTGGGKTVIGTRVVADCIAAGKRVLWLAHRTELIDQAEEKIKADTSGMHVGVVQGARRQYDAQVIVGSVATVVKPAALAQLQRAGIGLVVVDECHHAVAPSYMTIMGELGVLSDSGPRAYGITATLDRADGLALGDLWQDVAHTIPIEDLIERGFLLRPIGKRVKIDELNVGRLRASASQAQLDAAYGAAMAADSLAPAAIARAVLEHCEGRKGVAFLPTVELSREQARVFCEHGLRAVHIDADTPKAVRKEIWKQARAGRYDVVCNVGIATEGTDVPVWSYVVLARMTSSATLFTQMLGRGLRRYPGQTDCIVLDVVGVTQRHRIRVLATLDGAPRPEDVPGDLLEYEQAAEDAEPNETERRTPAEPEPEPEGVDGPLTSELIDLFSASHTAWLQSPRGVWFLPVESGARGLFLAPGETEGTYDVRWTDGELVHEDSLPLDTAMSWGEKAARAEAKRDLSRDAGWRQRKLTRAERLQAVYRGLRPDDVGRDSGTLSAAQDRLWAGRTIDVLPCVEKVTPRGYWQTY